MTLYGLRLLVALLTFVVGVAAAWLFNFKSTPVVVQYEVTESVAVLSDTKTDKSPPSHSCSGTMPKIVVQGGTLNFKAVSKPAPTYPPAAKAAGVTGTVVVRIVVDESGEVLTAEATSGPLLLREAAETAARLARFTPTMLAGQPIRVAGDLTYNFWLK